MRKRSSDYKKVLKRQSTRLRLSVFRSNLFIYAQIIDDTKGATLVSASSQKGGKGLNIAIAKEVGKALGEAAVGKNITSVYFDRGRYRFHGRVKALADGAREAGLIF
jgi:large subunit ribosomal protein L18